MGFVTYHSIFPKTYEFSNSKINNGLSSSLSSYLQATCALVSNIPGAT